VGALLGMDIRIGAPGALQPSAEVQGIARQLAEHSKARITITESPSEAVDGADFVYTDVWLSMASEGRNLTSDCRSTRATPRSPGRQ